jgi:hypothetical protein
MSEIQLTTLQTHDVLPTDEYALNNLSYLINVALIPIKLIFGNFKVIRGYCAKAVPTPAYNAGLAVDFVPLSASLKSLFQWIIHSKIPYSCVTYEKRITEHGYSSWIALELYPQDVTGPRCVRRGIVKHGETVYVGSSADLPSRQDIIERSLYA